MKICTYPRHLYGKIVSELSEIDRISQERRYRVVFYWFTGVSANNLQCPQPHHDDDDGDDDDDDGDDGDDGDDDNVDDIDDTVLFGSRLDPRLLAVHW